MIKIIANGPDYLRDKTKLKKMSSAERKFYSAFRRRCYALPTPVWDEVKIGGWKGAWDFAWPDLKVVVDVHGGEFVRGHHTRGKNILDDYEKLMRAVHAGWTCVLFGGTQTEDEKMLSMLAEIIERKLVDYLLGDRDEV
jgi:hypothetical protein